MLQAGHRIKIAILGASGYTGAELLRLLADHDGVEIVALTADRHAGKTIGAVFPHLAGRDLPALMTIGAVDFSTVELVFCCLPHGTTQEVIAALPSHLRIVDLSADFRLTDVESYAAWYGHAHRAPALQREAVYGITELVRPALGNARLVANPGCYPTVAQLPLVPLVRAELIDADDIIIDAKSGVTGAGRDLKQTSLFAEVAEGITAYGVADHRHAPEIDQGLSAAAGRPITVNFTPHLVPMNRGILATIYVRLAKGADVGALRQTLQEAYRNERFVRVVAEGGVPSTHHVRGSNLCLIGLAADRLKGRAILVAAIDNLVKGASGQAVQNMNAMLGLPEATGLQQQPMFP
jgi:N-acetyl-gamma-glutamyl-phosphate reductase